MFKMPVQHVVNTLVKGMMQGQETPKGKGLLVSLDVQLTSHLRGGLESPFFRREVHLLYSRYQGAGSYISVFSFVKRYGGGHDPKKFEWKHEVTHDSCWRDLTLINNVYFEAAAEINKKRVDVGLPEVAPFSMTDHSAFDIFKPFQWVNVVQTKVHDDTRYKIEVV